MKKTLKDLDQKKALTKAQMTKIVGGIAAPTSSAKAATRS
jgi:hypothetical protein